MARKTGSINHVHKYFRRMDGLWACAGKEGCTHFMPKNMSPAPAGMMSDCWRCDKRFQLAPYNMETESGKPICDACTEIAAELEKYLEEKGLFEKPTGLAAFGARIVTAPVVEQPIEEWERQQSREYLESKSEEPPTEEEIVKNVYLRRKMRGV